MATIQGVYVALFGRPADPAGLAYFDGITNGGKDLAKIGVLSGQAEFTTRFAGQSNVQIITSIYQSLFNRAPEAAGLEFFANALNKGTLSINNIAIAILDGAQGDDKTTVTNKLAAADAFTKALDTATEQAAYTGAAAAQSGVNFLAGVTKSPATIPSTTATDAAVKAIVDAGAGTNPDPGAGVTINITAIGDTVGTTHANPAFKSTNANDTINVVNGAHITAASNYDAGLGNDTLKIVTGGNAVAAGTVGTAATFKGIETITTTAADAVALNLSKTTGLSTFEVDSSGAAVTVTDAAAGVQLSLKGVIGGAVTYNIKDDATGVADALSVKLSSVTTTAVNKLDVNGIEVLTVNATGSANTLHVDADKLQTLKIEGSGNLTLGAIQGASAQFKTVDASAATGNVELTLLANDTKYTGSKGIDTVTLAGGKDVVVFNANNLSTANKADWVKAFTVADDKFDVSAFASTATGSKIAITTFTSAAADGDGFGGNAVAIFGNGAAGAMVYVDIDGNNKFDAATDLAFKVDFAANATDTNFIWG